MRSRSLWLLCLAALACDDDDNRASPDGARPDAEVTLDAAPLDASDPDAGPSDVSDPDATPTDAAPAPEPLQTLTASGQTLEIDPDGRARLLRGGEVTAELLRWEAAILPDDFALEPHHYLDPHQEQYLPITWRPLTACAEGRLSYGEGCDLSLRWSASESFTAELVMEGVGDRLMGLRAVLAAPEGEAYYGTGEVFDALNHRGLRRAMQFEVELIESGYNERHFPIPLLIGTRGWGVFVESRRPGDFDVAASDPGEIRLAFQGRALKLHLLPAIHPLDALERYAALTARPAVPPEWAFGGHLWRNANEDQAEVEADMEAIRAHDLPLSVIWIDRPWQTHYNSFVMNPAQFPDPEGLVRRMDALGFRLVFWSTPYLKDDLPEIWQDAFDRGLFVASPPDWPHPWGADMVDLTNPEAQALWRGLVQRAVDLGARGFKLDYAEDIQAGVMGRRFEFGFFNGEDALTMHQAYSRYFHQPYHDVLEGEGFLLTRAGTYGDQALTTTVWPGDLQSSFHHHGESALVGGLPAAVIGGLSLSASGYPFYASDTGGYRGGRPTKEVLLRWAAYSALGSVMQTGGAGVNHNPWDFQEIINDRGEPSRYDQETIDVFRRFARLHLRLHAYRDPFNRRAGETGRPVTTPIGLLHPELGRHPDFMFALGEDLYVAPVVDASGVAEVLLPEGRFFEWFTGEVVEGPATFTRAVLLDQIALYVKAGAIIPLLDARLDTLAPAGDPEVLAWPTFAGDLEVRLYPPYEDRVFETVGETRIRVEGGALTFESARFERLWVHRPVEGRPPEEVQAGARLELTQKGSR